MQDALPSSDPVADAPGPDRETWLRHATTAFVAVGLLLRLVRYLAGFPMWCDELRLAANVIDLGYSDLGRPLRYAQVCPVGFLAVEISAVRLLGFSTWSLRLAPLLGSLASVVLFRHVAGRLLSGLPLLLAVGTFSVSWWPVGFAAEVKPYATDLFVSLALLALAVEWLRRPDQTRWLWALGGCALIGAFLSLPSVFVTGGVCLALALPVWGTRRPAAWGAFAALAVAPALAFVWLLPVYRLDPKVQAFMDDYWAGAFPPLGNPLRLIGWLAEAHTGVTFAYPIGYAWGGSVLTTLCFALGAWELWSRRRRALLVLGLAPLALCFGAALLHRYPYGDQPRTMQFFVPAVCLFAALGLARVLHALPSRQARRGLLGATLLVYVSLAGASLVLDLVRPYKLYRDHQAREFAAWFWENFSGDCELACARADFGLVVDPAHWDVHFTEYYLCYQQIYSERLRRKRPPRMDLVSATHPLKCVFFNESPEASPAFQAWMTAMRRALDFRGVREYTVTGAGPRGLNFANRYRVYEFVPRPGANPAVAAGMLPARLRR
ncbi:MAG: hypothetical protein U0835_01960 [Isosphaeraceae bacterium]